MDNKLLVKSVIYFPEPCQSNPCGHGRCIGRSGPFSCVCDAGYTGQKCDTSEFLKHLI